ncbi:MAG: hypothetical protein JWN73_4390 [Betaproteobacteria bacterium]|nr:hypothetical protein [Betaproteobacteria bacterium]
MRIPFDFHHSLPKIPAISRELAFIVAVLALLLVTAGVLAQPLPGKPDPGVPPVVTPDKGGSEGAVDCTRAANKSLAACSQDNVGRGGISRTAPAGVVDRGIQKDAPRTNDGMSGPATGSASRPSDISEGKKAEPR